MKSRTRAQSGNILFLILLAVVLFAALTYAVTSSMRGGGKDASSESTKAAAADILQFFSQVDAAVLRMQMSGNLKPETISFEYPTKLYSGTTSLQNVNANCTSDLCRVYMPDGGSVSTRIFEKYAFTNPPSYQATWISPGYHFARMMVWPQAGTSLNDLAIVIPAIKSNICDEINAQQNTGYATLTGSAVAAVPASGWDSSASQSISSSNANVFADKTIFLVASVNGYCDIYHLVFAR